MKKGPSPEAFAQAAAAIAAAAEAGAAWITEEQDAFLDVAAKAVAARVAVWAYELAPINDIDAADVMVGAEEALDAVIERLGAPAPAQPEGTP